MIAADLDSTLLDDEKNVPDENLAALKECLDRGITVVIATGRTRLGIPEELLNLPGLRYAITINGARVVDLKTGEVLDTCCLDHDLALSLLEKAKSSPYDIMYDASIDGTVYTCQGYFDRIGEFFPDFPPRALEMFKNMREAVSDNIEYVRDNADEVDKVNYTFSDLEERSLMREELKKIPGIVVTSSIPTNLEINAIGADKGGALLWLADMLGIKREETMAFGDSDNDLTMIRDAGFGVAMENAGPALKAAADYITASNNDSGVAKAIKRFVFNG